MTDTPAWGGASDNEALRQGHHAYFTNEKVSFFEVTIQEVSAALSPFLKSAKQSPQLVDFAEPLEKLLNQLNGLVGLQMLGTLRECIAALLRAFLKLEAKYEQQAGVLEGLQARIEELKKEIEKLKKERQSFQEDRRKVLLCQVAYTFDQVARDVVFGPGCQLLTLVDLANYYKHQILTIEEFQRYDNLCAFIKEKGCEIDKLITLLRPLREVRCKPARPEELHSVTTKQLLEWASECGYPQRYLEQVLPLLQLFTQPEKPLVLCQNLSKVVKEDVQEEKQPANGAQQGAPAQGVGQAEGRKQAVDGGGKKPSGGKPAVEANGSTHEQQGSKASVGQKADAKAAGLQLKQPDQPTAKSDGAKSGQGQGPSGSVKPGKGGAGQSGGPASKKQKK